MDKQMRYIHLMEYCLAMKGMSYFYMLITLVNLKNLLSERHKMQKTAYHMIPFIWNVLKRQISRNKADCGLLRLGV